MTSRIFDKKTLTDLGTLFKKRKEDVDAVDVHDISSPVPRENVTDVTPKSVDTVDVTPKSVDTVDTSSPVPQENVTGVTPKSVDAVKEGGEKLQAKSMNRQGKYVVGVGKSGQYAYFGKVTLDNDTRLQVTADTKFYKIKARSEPVTQEILVDDLVLDYFESEEDAFVFLTEQIQRTEAQFFAEMTDSRLAKLFTDATNVSRDVSINEIIRCAIAMHKTKRYDSVVMAVEKINEERRLKRSANKARIFNSLSTAIEIHKVKSSLGYSFQ